MSPKMSEQYNSQGFIRSLAPQYIGVWQGHGSEWVARIRLRWNWLIIGTFETAEEAAIAHDEAALRFRGAGARLNFPKRVSTTAKEMLLKDAAKHLKVSISTLKRNLQLTSILHLPLHSVLSLYAAAAAVASHPLMNHQLKPKPNLLSKT
ncbi:hypothetical protein Vadar_009923 [Vaccinium darrowii]|uniref:Uncharacterized protein n=1 Tax=Vaccinium darrowii TaxID=229202 RepID=A0ACB7YVC2_9ERIC|nr:hypothetical protein Vadar_009923 [Vaccinium darrowii]